MGCLLISIGGTMLDPKEEAKFAELKSKCRELKVPAPPEIMIGLQVHEGGVLTFDDVQRGHSWTRNIWNLWGKGMIGATAIGSTYAAGSLATKTQDGTVSTGMFSNWNQIVVGTGDTAYSIENFAMAGKIDNGNGAGQLLYSTLVPITPVVYDSGTHIWKQTFTQIFNNNSGSSITVKETGLHDYNLYGILIERSVLSPTVAVANGAQLTVTYSISMDFSAID
jgi:hypothetical protein